MQVCFHTTRCTSKDDDGNEPIRLVGPRQTPKVLSKEQIVSRAMLGFLKKKQTEGIYFKVLFIDNMLRVYCYFHTWYLFNSNLQNSSRNSGILVKNNELKK